MPRRTHSDLWVSQLWKLFVSLSEFGWTNFSWAQVWVSMDEQNNHESKWAQSSWVMLILSTSDSSRVKFWWASPSELTEARYQYSWDLRSNQPRWGEYLNSGTSELYTIIISYWANDGVIVKSSRYYWKSNLGSWNQMDILHKCSEP